MRLGSLGLVLLALGATACDFGLDPLDVPLDLGVPDLQPDLTRFDATVDGPLCPNGLPPKHGAELSDPPLDRWLAEPLQPYNATPPTTTVALDTTRTIVGEGSLRLDTTNGSAALLYPSSREGNYDLTPFLYVSFYATADDSAKANDPGWQGAQPHLLVVTDATDYYEYIPTDAHLPRTPGAFSPVTIPFGGGYGWLRNTIGSPDLTHVAYIALTFESWGAGFTVWIDDLVIGPGLFEDCGN